MYQSLTVFKELRDIKMYVQLKYFGVSLSNENQRVTDDLNKIGENKLSHE